jgi:hypothetical protein
MSARDKFEPRRFRLVGDAQVEHALATLEKLLPSLPRDPKHVIEVVVQEEPRKRGLDANALMWAGPLKDMATQAYVEGRTFSAEVWHDFFKREFLPEQYDPELCKSDAYRKWDFDPGGNRVLVGSTTDLTVRGFSEHLEQVFAFGANFGVEFSADPRQYK